MRHNNATRAFITKEIYNDKKSLPLLELGLVTIELERKNFDTKGAKQTRNGKCCAQFME